MTDTKGWHHTGRARPDFAITPGDGQESVWDYPRPPVIVADTRTVVIRCDDVEIARSNRACRVLETAGAPAFYLPPADVNAAYLQRASQTSFCEWKGDATYWDVVTAGDTAPAAMWSYDTPTQAFQAIAGWLSCYAEHLHCTVDGHRVHGQPGGFYGGWVTPEIVGPFKGEPGTGWW